MARSPAPPPAGSSGSPACAGSPGANAVAANGRPAASRRSSPAAPAGPATRPGPRSLYLGTSSYEIADGLQAPVLIRATNRGGQISALWPIAARCARGPRTLFINQTPLTGVRADGTFARSERFSVRYADALIHYRTRFTGRFLGQGATGTLRPRARIFSRNGKTLRTRCDSGTRTWSTALAP